MWVIQEKPFGDILLQLRPTGQSQKQPGQRTSPEQKRPRLAPLGKGAPDGRLRLNDQGESRSARSVPGKVSVGTGFALDRGPGGVCWKVGTRVPVVQLDRASASGAEGSRFEFCLGRLLAQRLRVAREAQ